MKEVLHSSSSQEFVIDMRGPWVARMLAPPRAVATQRATRGRGFTPSLLDVEQLDFETDGRALRDRTLAGFTEREPPRDDQGAFFALFHRQQGLIPALDHPIHADWEGERLPAVARAVEFRAI